MRSALFRAPRLAVLLTPLSVTIVMAAAPAAAQPMPAVLPEGLPGEFDLSVANIMRGELLVGRSPNEVRWSEDSRHVYFRWRDPESIDTTTYIYRVPGGGGTPERVLEAPGRGSAPAREGSWSADRRSRAFERDGDVFVRRVDGSERRVTQSPVRERLPHLSPDGRTVYYLSGDNVFAVDLSGGPVRQLTDIRTSEAPKKEDPKDQARFLEEQQSELLEAVRDRAVERRHREALDSLRRGVHPVFTGRNTSVASARVSPSGRHLLLGITQRTEEKRTIVPNFVTESGYTEDLVVRSKVGDVQAGQRVALLDLETGELRWLSPGSEAREMTLVPVGWAPRADRALLIGLAMDHKDRWIYAVEPGSGPVVLDHLRDEAWVGGPGLYTAGFLPDGERVYFVSERTGFAHLYTVRAAGGTATPITEGRWEVTDVELSGDGRTFFITTSETHPGERHLYAVSTGGGERRRLTSLEGWNESLVSPNGRTVAILNSRGNQPPDLFVQPLGRGPAPRRVTLSTTEEFRSGFWIEPEIVVFPARDGAQVHARIYRPADFGVEPNGAAVLFVHGAGYLQNVHRGWSSYYREYMFHHLLASRGYTVLDVDYRASAGYGRDWRVGIYRHMGGKDLTDHVDAASYLVANEGIDPARVGIYGGSYGGFITLMALFTEPDVFRSGAALRSVTDWAHYNHPYTSRILNQPQDDPEAYRRSSPIYFAEGLRGDLLITHGMVDTNVHFQDVVRLAQRLIELGKTNWEMAVYPVEDHGFVRPDSWTDQYRRILELFERTLR